MKLLFVCPVWTTTYLIYLIPYSNKHSRTRQLGEVNGSVTTNLIKLNARQLEESFSRVTFNKKNYIFLQLGVMCS